MAVNFMSSNKIDITSRFVNIYKESKCSHNCYLMSVQWRPEDYLHIVIANNLGDCAFVSAIRGIMRIILQMRSISFYF